MLDSTVKLLLLGMLSYGHHDVTTATAHCCITMQKYRIHKEKWRMQQRTKYLFLSLHFETLGCGLEHAHCVHSLGSMLLCVLRNSKHRSACSFYNCLWCQICAMYLTIPVGRFCIHHVNPVWLEYITNYMHLNCHSGCITL